MKLCYGVLPLIGMAASSALAQSTSQWDSTAAITRAASECNIPSTYVSAELGADGVVRVQVSPSITAYQADCAVNVIKGFGVRVRR
ncbi:hypothetical protein [Novosphingobium sp. 9U]|uniref:hypothetical protein n=1 Tax=Novosphingobium sp. 9U TaxID=2653158 RepID=UPI0012F3B75B|nr:hypothetical protein [Novosphingobium sp. 9U]VWX53361.1 exported hypothetical protein [Novosphingobium sp. 9U]